MAAARPGCAGRCGGVRGDDIPWLGGRAVSGGGNVEGVQWTGTGAGSAGAVAGFPALGGAGGGVDAPVGDETGFNWQSTASPP